jgi:winged helix DNA-binding protein
MTLSNLSTEQVLHFRSRRNGLIGEPGDSLAQSAHGLLGAQAQIETYAFNALSLRTAGRPSADEVKRRLHETQDLVRTWGQRDTLHLYAKEDWPLFHSASSLWVRSSRIGAIPPESLLNKIDAHFAAEGCALTRSDLFPLIPQSFVKSVLDHPGAGGTNEGAKRFAATRVIWVLANRGRLVFADKIGREVSYLHRSAVWSGEWPEMDPEKASQEVVRRYLSTFGPATVQDAAHYLGARVSDVRLWFEAISEKLVTCRHSERGELKLLEVDAGAVQEPVGEWPLRLLPAYDTMLMSHKDKRWILPQAELESQVWKKSAVVAAAVLLRGRIVGTWTYKKTKKRVDLEIRDFGVAKLPTKELQAEQQRLAHHLKLEPGKLTEIV